MTTIRYWRPDHEYFDRRALRRHARVLHLWALGVGAALITMAAISSARADIVAIDLDRCSASCIAGIDGAAADDAVSANDDAVSMTRSVSEGAGNSDFTSTSARDKNPFFKKKTGFEIASNGLPPRYCA